MRSKRKPPKNVRSNSSDEPDEAKIDIPEKTEIAAATARPGTATARDILIVVLATPPAMLASPPDRLLEMNRVAAEGNEPEVKPMNRACKSESTPTSPTSVVLS